MRTKKKWKFAIEAAFKLGFKASFAIAYCVVFGLFILIGWAAEGAGLAITLAILFGIGYFVIVKMTKLFLKIAANK
jgi:hypothetical protein